MKAHSILPAMSSRKTGRGSSPPCADGHLDPIKALVLDTSANEFCRAVGLSALALLAAWAEVPREPIVDCFLWLAREGLEREPSQVWNGLAADSADIEALVVFPELRRRTTRGSSSRNACSDPSWTRRKRHRLAVCSTRAESDIHPLTMSSAQRRGGHPSRNSTL